MPRPTALTIAGSDPSGGAGLQADIAVLTRHGVRAAAVPTLLTVQTRRQVRSVAPIDPGLVDAQLAAVLEDGPIAAAKCGALGSAGIVQIIAARLAATTFPLVVDPVLVSSSGAPLLDDDGVRVLVERLVPRATLLTPNAIEAARLTGLEVRDRDDASRAGRALLALGPRAVLVKGGHLAGEERAVDVLVDARGEVAIEGPRGKASAHGTGCALSASIAARLARGEPIERAVRGAKRWLASAIASSSDGVLDLFEET